MQIGSLIWSLTSDVIELELQGGSNMTGTDLYVNKPHCKQLCDIERVKPQPPPFLLLGLEPVQSCLGVARVMSEQKVPRSVEQCIVIKFLVGENVPSAEIHHRLQQQYGEECLLRRCTGTGNTGPVILKLDHRWRWFVEFTNRSLHIHGNSCLYRLNKRVSGLQERDGCFGEEINLLHLLWIELQRFYHYTTIQVNILTVLSQLYYHTFICTIWTVTSKEFYSVTKWKSHVLKDGAH